MEATRNDVNASQATPWRRHPRALVGALALICVLATTASAQAGTWHGVNAGAPATVKFLDLASAKIGLSPTTPVVIAVGTDGTAPATTAVIYRMVGSTWYQDTLPTPDPASSLKGVAIAGGVAWAVGWTGDGTTNHPFAVRLAPGSLTAAGPAAWSQITIDSSNIRADSTATAIGSLALSAAAAPATGATGYVSAGKRIYPATDDGVSTATIGAAINTQTAPTDPPTTTEVPANGGIDALSVYGPGAGFAGAAKDGTDSRYFQLSGSSVAAAPFVESTTTETCGTNLNALSSTTTATADSPPKTVVWGLGIEDGCWWSLDTNGVWERHGEFESTSHFHDVAIANPGNRAVAAIGGDIGGQGAVWRATNPGTLNSDWTVDSNVSTAPIEAVSVLGSDDIWAAGDGGVVRHWFTDPPPPPPPPTDSGTTTTGGDQPVVDSGSSPAPDPGYTDPGTGPSAGTVPVQVVQPTATPPKPPARKRRHRRRATPARLMTGVAVKKANHALVISFTLTAPAAVTVYATEAGRQVALSKPLRLRKGPGKLVIRYAGKSPPAQLKIVVRPVRKAGS